MSGNTKSNALFARGLEHLLKASSKATAEKAINLVFAARNDSDTSACEVSLSALLELDASSAHELFMSINECISVTLYDTVDKLQSLAELFEEKAESVDRKLKQLIGQIINSKLEIYREASYMSRVSLPQLTGVDWFVSVKRASSEIPDMQVPCVVLQLNIQEEQAKTDILPKVEKVNLELTSESLGTMLEGLGRIRDQLSAM